MSEMEKLKSKLEDKGKELRPDQCKNLEFIAMTVG